MAVPVTTLFTSADLRSRIGDISYNRVFDDDGFGVASAPAVTLLISDSSATVWSYLPTDYVIGDDGVPEYLRKLALDVAQATAYIRHPEFNRQDGHEMLSRAHKDLERFKKQMTALPEVTRGDTYAVVSTTASNDTGNQWIR